MFMLLLEYGNMKQAYVCNEGVTKREIDAKFNEIMRHFDDSLRAIREEFEVVTRADMRRDRGEWE